MPKYEEIPDSLLEKLQNITKDEEELGKAIWFLCYQISEGKGDSYISAFLSVNNPKVERELVNRWYKEMAENDEKRSKYEKFLGEISEHDLSKAEEKPEKNNRTNQMVKYLFTRSVTKLSIGHYRALLKFLRKYTHSKVVATISTARKVKFLYATVYSKALSCEIIRFFSRMMNSHTILREKNVSRLIPRAKMFYV